MRYKGSLVTGLGERKVSGEMTDVWTGRFGQLYEPIEGRKPVIRFECVGNDLQHSNFQIINKERKCHLHGQKRPGWL